MGNCSADSNKKVRNGSRVGRKDGRLWAHDGDSLGSRRYRREPCPGQPSLQGVDGYSQTAPRVMCLKEGDQTMEGKVSRTVKRDSHTDIEELPFPLDVGLSIFRD